MSPLLTGHQARVAERALAEEERHREHLVVSLSGAHAYGVPSPDTIRVRVAHLTCPQGRAGARRLSWAA